MLNTPKKEEEKLITFLLSMYWFLSKSTNMSFFFFFEFIELLIYQKHNQYIPKISQTPEARLFQTFQPAEYNHKFIWYIEMPNLDRWMKSGGVHYKLHLQLFFDLCSLYLFFVVWCCRYSSFLR